MTQTTLRKLVMSTIPILALTALLLSSLLHADDKPSQDKPSQSPLQTEEQVGPAGNNRFVTPVNQILTPAGIQVSLPSMRPQVLALSPEGRLLLTSGKTSELIVLDPQTGKVKQHVALPSEDAKLKNGKPPKKPGADRSGQVSYTGLVFSPDGKRVYLSNVNGSIKVFGVDEKGTVAGLFTIPLPAANAPDRSAAIPAGLVISPDGTRLYVALNLSNRLAEIDTKSGKVTRFWNVGVAPYDVVLLADKAYVSNWGGRRPVEGTLTGPAGRGTHVRVDPVRHIASEGSVSVVDLSVADKASKEQSSSPNAAPTLKQSNEILVGLHASALALSPDKRHLAVACAGSDYVRVIETQTDKLVETIWPKHSPAALLGASPNALAFSSDGKWLYIANGTQNAIAVVEFAPHDSSRSSETDKALDSDSASEFEGLIPVGWYPGAILCDSKRNMLYVANIKGSASTLKDWNLLKKEHNTHRYHGTLSLVKIPKKKELAKMTEQVLINFRYPLLKKAALPARPNQPARPVPERVGEPSVFEHVVYIIKENRTYDQVLGDIEKGNGDKSLCTFGENVTPNQHKMVQDFVLLDNTYCSGILSADGHQWADTAFATDYMEKSFAGFPRSYPDGMEESDIDALAYASSGFIWDNALAQKKTIRVYGEFAITETTWKDKTNRSRIRFLDCYNDFINKTNKIDIRSRASIESLRPHLCTKTVGWSMKVPDIFRAAQFIKELKEYEKKGELPNLMIICLPNDHTSGTGAGSPTPAAHIADNDLAFGQIVDAISHSAFWKKTCIFGIEDDPQAGWDHVSGYRTTAYVISPYTKRGEVVSTQYNQTSLLRTMELILGLPPMNQMDATATPMTDCFTSKPDFTPFDVVPNNIPLDQMNPDPNKTTSAAARRDAIASARLPLDKVDQCDEDTLNRILWHAMKGHQTPYPAWAVTKDADDD